MSLACYEYTTRSGDSIDRIIYDMYGWTPTRQPGTYKATLQGVLAMNPHLADPDRLADGTILRLPPDPTSASLRAVRPPMLRQQEFASESLTAAERERVTALAWLARNSNWLTVPGSVAAGTATSILHAGNRQLLIDIGELYADYKQGRITRTAYRAQRAAKLAQFKSNIGPFERLLYPKKGVVGAMRQGIRLLPPDISLTEVARLKRLAGFATTGGVILTGVGITAGCISIANTVDRREKNEIFVETIASTTAGMFLGTALGVFLVSNPLGWGTALLLAMGSAAASWGAGKGATYAYDKLGNQVDFVNGFGVDKICR